MIRQDEPGQSLIQVIPKGYIPLALQYTGIARALALTHDQNNYFDGRTANFVQQWTMRDGTFIELVVNEWNRTLFITSPLPVVEDEEEEPEDEVILRFATGLIEVWSIPDWNVGRWHPAYPLENWQVGKVDPSGADPTYLTGYEDWIIYNKDRDPHPLPISNDNDQAVRFALDRGNPYFTTYAPTEYSGSMVKHVQMMHSLNTKPNSFLPLDTQTHGLYRVGQDNKNWWVIEAGLTGVFAWPIKFIEIDAADQATADAYQFYPDPDEPFEFDINKRVQLASASDIEQVYLEGVDDKRAFYATAGWAFSTYGNNAVIVVRNKREYDDGGTPGTLWYSERWIMNITDDGESPASASFTLASEGWLRQGGTNVNLRVPVRALYKNILDDWSVTPMGGDQPLNGKAPIHSWYAPFDPTVPGHDGALVDVDYEFEEELNGQIVTDTRTGELAYNRVTSCSPGFLEVTLDGRLGTHTKIDFSVRRLRRFDCRLLDSGDGNVFTTETETIHDTEYITTTGSPIEVLLANCPNGPNYAMQQSYHHFFDIIGRTFTTNVHQSLQLPIFARECALLYDGNYRLTQAHNIVKKLSGAGNTRWGATYTKPPGHSGGINVSSRGFDFLVLGPVTIDTIPVPQQEDYIERFTAAAMGTKHVLSVPGYTNSSVPYSDPLIDTVTNAVACSYDSPNEVIVQNTDIDDYNNSRYPTPPEAGQFQPILTMFGNHKNEKPWED